VVVLPRALHDVVIIQHLPAATFTGFKGVMTVQVDQKVGGNAILVWMMPVSPQVVLQVPVVPAMFVLGTSEPLPPNLTG
jgi:hypothetical protein